ncbi:hypothetical protein EJ06DRAFT_533341 [Trichodelitschia bisporula]|uniref:Uncharacterized protein n=1 Tax=Trichodelitschia bisporula TaxID=703511 RepID=A0A6G1HN20_9PEZI|nr:hypothetical protein EJ06DRAFT_533341 [Trichodelitschia bisporula]
MRRLPALTFLIFATSTAAFGTVNEPLRIGQHCEHERLTRAALGCPPGRPFSDAVCFEDLSLMQIAGTSGPDGHIGRGFNGAVGAPDTLDPVPEGPHAHCDNADFFDHGAWGLDGKYPRSRAQATETLQACIDHLRTRMMEGLDAAEKIVDDHTRINEGDVDIRAAHCVFSFPDLQLHLFSRGKCSALEGLGRALHGVQDFWAHSNWGDRAVAPFGLDNPPGLNREDLPPFMDLRAENHIAEQVPHHLSTGCFGGLLTDGAIGQPGHPLEPGSLDCTGRVTHHTLNKDNGIIDPVTGATKDPGPNTPRSDLYGNFQAAVSGAILDTQRQWRHFREEIRRLYGSEKGNIIICALIRDNPASDCYGRRIAIVADREFGSNVVQTISYMHTPIESWILSELQGSSHDEGEFFPTNDTNSSAHATAEMTFSVLAGAGGNFDGGFDTGSAAHFVTASLDIGHFVSELVADANTPANKSAVILLTHAHPASLSEQIRHIWRAGDEHIRVHIGFILPSPPSPDPALDAQRLADLRTAILRTGGTYAALHNSSQVGSFLHAVVSRGLTGYDNGPDTATLLLPGLSIADYVSPGLEPRRLTFEAQALRNAVVSVAPLTEGLAIRVLLRHVRLNTVLREAMVGEGGNATFRGEVGITDVPREDSWFELEVEHRGGKGSGCFEVSLEMEG